MSGFYGKFPTCLGLKLWRLELQWLGYWSSMPWRIGFDVKLDAGDCYNHHVYAAVRVDLLKIRLSLRFWVHTPPVDLGLFDDHETDQILEDTAFLMNDGAPQVDPLDAAVEGTGDLFEDTPQYEPIRL